jgi:hypothetical protein
VRTLIIPAALAAALAVPASAASAADPTYIGVNCGFPKGDKIAPRNYYPNCASASWPAALKLRWRDWGSSQAVGTGLISVPYINEHESFAEAKRPRFEGHVTAYRPRYCANGKRKYTRARFVANAPRRSASGRERVPPMPLKVNLDVCENGEPTVSSVPPSDSALLAVASASVSSPVRECGNLNGSTRNVTTRNVTCLTAGRLIGRIGFIGYGKATMRRGGYTCRVRIPDQRSWWLDVRCTRFGDRVIRWQYESGD